MGLLARSLGLLTFLLAQASPGALWSLHSHSGVGIVTTKPLNLIKPDPRRAPHRKRKATANHQRSMQLRRHRTVQPILKIAVLCTFTADAHTVSVALDTGAPCGKLSAHVLAIEMIVGLGASTSQQRCGAYRQPKCLGIGSTTGSHDHHTRPLAPAVEHLLSRFHAKWPLEPITKYRASQCSSR